MVIALSHRTQGGYADIVSPPCTKTGVIALIADLQVPNRIE